MVKRLTQKVGTKRKDEKAYIPCWLTVRENNEGLTLEKAELKK